MILTYGCKPGRGVKARSDLSPGYFKLLQKYQNRNGEVSPHERLYLLSASEGNCENTIAITLGIKLKW